MKALTVPTLLLAGFVLLAGCADDPSKPRYELIPDMVDSVAYEAFAHNPNTRDGKTLIAPAAGTIPRGFTPFHYGPGPEEAARAGREVQNPLPADKAALARGQEAFGVFCTPCHGKAGLGDGLLIPRFPVPPSLVAERAKKMPDGQLFHVISRGQGLMPSHATQIAAADRWRIIHYVRSLQAPAAGAPSTGGSR